MSSPARGRSPLPALLALVAATALLAGCGAKKTAVAGNDVQMRDMEVVDGTTNDAMTDLDAVKADGVGTSANNAAAPSVKAKPAAEATPNKGDETVGPE